MSDPVSGAPETVATAVMPRTGIHLRIHGLQRVYDGRTVLDGIDLDVAPSETLVILGGSGAGKTTLFRHLMGLERPDGGGIAIDGQDLADMDADGLSRYRRELGVVFQHAALLGSLTVFENLALPLREVDGLSDAAARPLVAAALKRVLLDPGRVMPQRPADLSGGMRKRVGLARAIVRRPRLMLYDEPTTGLDPVTTAAVSDLIKAQQRDLGTTSIVITHDLGGAFAVADRLAMLHQGRIRVCAAPAAFRADPDPVLRQFLDGRVDGPMNETAIITRAERL
jgi:phospholipid/cholesterol/gamma-HCH transport system ATP-binding protein